MTAAATPPRPVVLCILDGWGYRAETHNNAIAQANTPVWDRLMATCPHGLGNASEHHVGLPEGQMGNSEVGHMNIGAGRIVLQDLPKIDAAVADGTLTSRAPFRKFVASLRKSGGTAHVMGLMSDGGVHSHQDHVVAVVRALDAAGIPVVVHAFLDGRDTPPRSADRFLAAFEAAVADCTKARIGTVSGRYYAMDRDKRWDRVEKAYAMLSDGTGARTDTAADAVEGAWQRDETDEFAPPTAIGDYQGMKDGDGLFMVNFRSVRGRSNPGDAGCSRAGRVSRARSGRKLPRHRP